MLVGAQVFAISGKPLGGRADNHLMGGPYLAQQEAPPFELLGAWSA
jgi:hypothetical protein